MQLFRIRDYLRPIWRRLLTVHVAFTLLAFAAITPLFGLLLRGLLALSGNAAVADQDIALLLLSPLGLAGGVLLWFVDEEKGRGKAIPWMRTATAACWRWAH